MRLIITIIFLLFATSIHLFSQNFPVVINEIMVTPAGGTAANSLYDSGVNTGSVPLFNAQWIEFYNMSPCDSFDIGCYLVASDMSFGNDTNKGVFRFFGGTVIPPLGYLVVGGNGCAVKDFNIFTDVDSNFCMSERWWLNDEAGWIALYDLSSNPKSAVYWNHSGTQADLYTLPQYANDVETNIQRCTCCSPGMMVSATQFSNIQFCGNTIPNSGFSLARRNDGSNEWVISASGGTPKACNAGPDSIYNLEVVLSGTNPICHGESTGSISSSLSIRGVPRYPYSYLWSNGSSMSSVSNVSSGSYSLTVTDAFGCETYQTVILQDPPVLHLQETHANVKCYNGQDCSASIYPTGGVPPYHYQWNTLPVSTDSIISNISSGSYFVTVTDSVGCSAIKNIFITQPTEMSAGSEILNACTDSSNGEIKLSVYGGTPPYISVWSDGSTGDTLAHLSEGIYTVTITDTNSCQLIQNFVVNNSVITLNNISDIDLCNGATANINASATGGLIPYTFNWIINTDTISGSSILISPESSTDIFLMVEDARFCPGTSQSIHVNVFPPLSFNVTSNKDSLCPGEIIAFDVVASGGNGYGYHFFYEDSFEVSFPWQHTLYHSGFIFFKMFDECNSSEKFDSVFVYIEPYQQAQPALSSHEGCVPFEVKFSTEGIDSAYHVSWNTGDGNSFSLQNFTYLYEIPGSYNVFLDVTSPGGCLTNYSILQPVKVHNIPDANFSFFPSEVTMLKPEIQFLNYSSTFYSCFWNFNDGTQTDSFLCNPNHVFPRPGDYNILLTVKDENGCMDTISKTVKVTDAVAFYAPTAFSPGKDGVNNVFNVFINGARENTFSLRIFDRWGLEVYQTTNLKEGWNGKIGVDKAPVDTYVWFVEFSDCNSVLHRKSGIVSIVD